MFTDIIFCFNAVLPLVILIVIGYIIKLMKVVPESFWDGADKIVFKVALPVFIFNDFSQSKIGDIFDLKLIIYCVSGIVLSFVLLMTITPFFIKNKPSRGAFIQGVYRSNYAILGLMLARNLFGEPGFQTAALILPFTIPLFNVFAVIVLTLHSANEANSKKIPIKNIFLGIIKNPLIISILISIPFLFLPPLPPVIKASVTYLSNLSTPLALLSLGAGINFAIIKSKVKLSFIASICRTVVMPLIFVTPAIFLGFRDAALTTIFVLFGAPTAVTSYIMAKNLKCDYEQAGQIIVLTTIICPVTIFVGSFVLKTLKLI